MPGHRQSRWAWTGLFPGEDEFNKKATANMKKDIVPGFSMTCDNRSGRAQPFPYQQTVSYLVSPQSPVDRLLVVHRTGTGKTFEMILMDEPTISNLEAIYSIQRIRNL